MTEEYNYARLAAGALMALRRETLASVCAATGINKHTLACFLDGTDAVLSDTSFHVLFRHLGVVATEKGAKLSPNRVHFFHLTDSVFRKRNSIKMFRMMLPMMDSVYAMALPRYKGLTPILVRGPHTRLVLLVRSGRIGGITLSDLGLVPGSFRGYEAAAKVPRSCKELLISQQVKASYFDLILEGDFRYESINMVWMAAIDRDVTLSEVVNGLIAGKIGPTSERQVMIDEAAYYQEKVVHLFPTHFSARGAA